MSTTRLSKILSVEVMGSMLAIAFAIGGTYTTLANGQEAQGAELNDVKKQQAAIVRTISKIQTDTAVIRNEQTHLSRAINDHSKDIKRILEILMKERGHKHDIP